MNRKEEEEKKKAIKENIIVRVAVALKLGLNVICECFSFWLFIIV